jgi:hypothetical protein
MDLATLLGRADVALAHGDTTAADVAMAEAADLCRRLQAAGLGVPADELGILRDLAERCGLALTRLGQELNAESFRDDNHRRGMVMYQTSLRRTG